jgi:hypothetical protein
MRVAPLGAAYADDPSAVVRPAADTAVITHTHPQAVDGAIAVAVAAAYAVRARTETMTPNTFLAAVAELTPRGAVRDGLTEAIGLLAEPDPVVAAKVLGNGSRTSAADTVPYALWCAARRLVDYRAAIWEAIAPGGDMDTVAAIAGGVVAARTGTQGIPAAWMAAREPLPDWLPHAAGTVRPAPPQSPDHLKPMLLPRPCPVPDVVWTEEQWRRIRSGLRSRVMEHKWESYTSEGVLHLHRSWTGFAIWSVRVAPVKGGGWRPVSALTEQHPDRYKGAPDPEGLAAVLRLAAEGYGWP